MSKLKFDEYVLVTEEGDVIADNSREYLNHELFTISSAKFEEDSRVMSFPSEVFAKRFCMGNGLDKFGPVKATKVADVPILDRSFREFQIFMTIQRNFGGFPAYLYLRAVTESLTFSDVERAREWEDSGSTILRIVAGSEPVPDLKFLCSEILHNGAMMDIMDVNEEGVG